MKLAIKTPEVKSAVNNTRHHLLFPLYACSMNICKIFKLLAKLTNILSKINFFVKKIIHYLMIQLYHNSRCSKSRQCLTLLEDSGKKFEAVKYLENPPTISELNDLISKLGIEPIDLVRKKEKLWIEKFKNKVLSSKELIEIMVKNPILIERPIVINGSKAVVARPIEKAIGII
jgi:arsenate reductase